MQYSLAIGLMRCSFLVNVAGSNFHLFTFYCYAYTPNCICSNELMNQPVNCSQSLLQFSDSYLNALTCISWFKKFRRWWIGNYMQSILNIARCCCCCVICFCSEFYKQGYLLTITVFLISLISFTIIRFVNIIYNYKAMHTFPFAIFVMEECLKKCMNASMQYFIKENIHMLKWQRQHWQLTSYSWWHKPSSKQFRWKMLFWGYSFYQTVYVKNVILGLFIFSNWHWNHGISVRYYPKLKIAFTSWYAEVAMAALTIDVIILMTQAFLQTVHL